ncbi:hypothetical protein NC652_039287 [Populus alba x Populus x berolinensis]|nr:hypothetical protein NC652_039287 [Populus alba x Populus x berolinensis]
MCLKNVQGEVISTRVSSAEQQGVAANQHTAAAIARPPVAHSLVQVFMNSSAQEEAVKHLDNAKISDFVYG